VRLEGGVCVCVSVFEGVHLYCVIDSLITSLQGNFVGILRVWRQTGEHGRGIKSCVCVCVCVYVCVSLRERARETFVAILVCAHRAGALLYVARELRVCVCVCASPWPRLFDLPSE